MRGCGVLSSVCRCPCFLSRKSAPKSQVCRSHAVPVRRRSRGTPRGGDPVDRDKNRTALSSRHTRAALTLTASHAHSRTLVRRAADGHGRAGIQAVVAFLTIASSFCSFAPVTVSRSFPSWYTWNVGIAITPFSCDTSSSSSTSTCARHVRSPSSGGAGRAERQTAEARGPLRRGCWLRTCPPASRRTGRSFGRDHTRSPCNRQPWSPRRSALARLPRPSQPQCVVLPQHLYPLSARWSRPSAPQ